MFKLGEKLRCKITGFEGIATSRTVYLNGCVQYCILPKTKKASIEYPEGIGLDEENLQRVSAGITIKPRKAGGPPRRGGKLTHR